MKTIFSIFISLLFAISLWAQPSNITGSISSEKISNVFLYKVLNGRLQEVASAKPDSQGRFAFRFSPEYEGFYCVGYSNSNIAHGNYKLYFKGNEDLTIKLGLNVLELIESNSPENNALAEWHKSIQSIAEKSIILGTRSTYVDFFPELELLHSKIKTFSKNPKTGNASFDNQFEGLVNRDLAFYAISYLYMPRSTHPSTEEFPEFYTNFKISDYMNDELLSYPFGDQFLQHMLLFHNRETKNYSFDNLIKSIPDGALKGQFFLKFAEQMKTMEVYLPQYEKYKDNLILPEQLSRASKVEARLAESRSGVPAFSFSFLDSNGKNISLKDLRGKIVLLDMWATWCGPCRAEEPHWEKLHEIYKDKAVAFVGISTDQEKDKWLSYVQEKNMKGIQLHAGPRNPLSEAYKVNAIPRYLLIDKKGNLITADSPRPSDPKLKELIDSSLSKN